MIKKIIPFLIGFAILFGLFYLLTHPQNLPENNSQTAANITPEITESIDNENIDPYKDFPVYDNPDLVFYWRVGCPHCENVEKWLNVNNIDSKIKVNFKEVYYSEENQQSLYETVNQYCPEMIEDGGIGVPTAFDPVGKQCIQGDTPIIDFLSSKLGK